MKGERKGEKKGGKDRAMKDIKGREKQKQGKGREVKDKDDNE